MASKVCRDEKELLADAYQQAETRIFDARADLWEVSQRTLPDNARQEVLRILSVLFDAAVSVRLLRSNVDGLLDGVLANIADTNADEVSE